MSSGALFEPEVSSQLWRGAHPRHWQLKRLKWSISGLYNGIWGDEPDGESDIICIRVADFDRVRRLVVSELPTVRSVHVGYREQRVLKKGDLLIEKSGGGDNQLVGCVVHFDHDFEAVCSNFVARVPLQDEMVPQYWNYVHSSLYSSRLNFPAIKQTTGIQNLDADAYFNIEVAFPPIEEQSVIASYLDREIIRIDGLIAEKERMLALLEEKRIALISRAVTRGLNPVASLKPSGQEWLGEIPCHWRVLRLKFAVSGIDQGSSPQCHSYPAERGEWGVLKTGCVNGGEFREQENKALPDEAESLQESEINQGDVLMSRASGSVDLIGSVAHVSRQPAARLLLSDKIYRFQVRRDVLDPRFIVLAMGARYLRHQIKSVISGAEGLANNIAKSDIMELLLVVPPVPEQDRIISYLDRAVISNKVLCNSLGESIALAKERRAALITTAVTGKIPLKEMIG